MPQEITDYQITAPTPTTKLFGHDGTDVGYMELGALDLAPQTIIKAKLKTPMAFPFHDLVQTDHLTFSGLVATLQASGSDPFAAVFGNGPVNAISEIVANLTTTLPAVAGTYWLYVERNPVTGALTLGATDVAPEYGQARRGVDAMPAHTTYAGAFGTVSASSEYDASYSAWRAFNKANTVNGDMWLTANSSVSGWLLYVMPKTRYLLGYSLASGYTSAVNSAPKTWTFKTGTGSTPDTTVDTQTNAAAFALGEVRTYFFSSPIACASFELNITANQGQTSYTSVGELTPLFADDFYHIPTNKLYKADGSQAQRVYVGKAISNGTAITSVVPFALGRWCTLAGNGGANVPATTEIIENNPFGCPVHVLSPEAFIQQYAIFAPQMDYFYGGADGAEDGVWVYGNTNNDIRWKVYANRAGGKYRLQVMRRF